MYRINAFKSVKYFSAFLCLIMLLGIVGCSNNKTNEKSVTIGSKPFTEGIILSEMMSQLIENNSSIKVVRKFNLGGTIIAFNALKNGDLDLYPEYTGTGLVAILKKEPQKDAQLVYDTTQKEFNQRYKLKWLKPLGFNNTYAISVKKEFAEKHHLKNLSDLSKISPTMIFGANQDFYTRPDGFEGLAKTYNLNFKDKKQMEIGLRYQAIDSDKVDIINGFATDGLLIAHNLTILKDDKNYFSPYHGAALVRMDTLEKYPELEKILNKLAGQITDGEMQKLNYKVDYEKKDPVIVAIEFLKTKHLIK